MSGGNGLLPPGAAAYQYHVSTSTLRRWEHLGYITAMRDAHGHVQYNEASIQRHLGQLPAPVAELLPADDVRPFLEAAAAALAVPVPAHRDMDDIWRELVVAHALMVLDGIRVLLTIPAEPATAARACTTSLRTVAHGPLPYE